LRFIILGDPRPTIALSALYHMKPFQHSIRALGLLLGLAMTCITHVPKAGAEEAPKDVIWKSKWKWLSDVVKMGMINVTTKNVAHTSVWEFSKDGVITITATKTAGGSAPTVTKGSYSFAADGKTITMNIPGRKEPKTGELKVSSSSLMTLSYSSGKDSGVEKWERTR